jgi:hypothetical protein
MLLPEDILRKKYEELRNEQDNLSVELLNEREIQADSAMKERELEARAKKVNAQFCTLEWVLGEYDALF